MYSHAACVHAEAFIIKDLAFQTFSVGTTENKSMHLTIYPNPTNGLLTLKGLESVNHSIQILDIQGKIVFEKSKQKNTIDISDLKPGIYFLKILNGDTYELKKIIKQ